MNNKDIIDSGDLLQVKLCCGCGVVNLGVGPVVFKLTKSAFLQMAGTIEKIADDLRGEKRDGTEGAGAIVGLQFADQKFLA